MSAAYPVGSIYINATSASNPSSLLGFGTWTAFGAGRVMVGLDASDALFDTAEETGGSKDSVVVSHTHTATSTSPAHSHNITTVEYNTGSSSGIVRDTAGGSPTTQATSSTTATVSTTITSTGSSGTNANVQPFIVVRMWKRTA